LTRSLLELPIIERPPPARPPRPDSGTLLDELLREQREFASGPDLTAVERFSAAHRSAPAHARSYSALLPAAPPESGQQYAFEVDLDRCSGCKACVTACHSLNGLDEGETWRDVGLLLGGSIANPLVQHVTTACHHCLNPACLAACPVDAYEKDPITGIVSHLDEQCFGCQYCTFACPYDVPKYHAEKGIVRKCDMCSNRLAVGEAPACVQACPHEAIAIRVVGREQVLEDNEVGRFLPGAPDPHLTHPTTTFKTSRVLPRNTLPADYRQTALQHPHWPLVVMLVLTQLSVGAFTVGQWARHALGERLDEFLPLHAAMALGLGVLALGASLLHLGRPQYAFRAVIGLRHSWLSREIVAFGLYAKLAALHAGLLWFRDELPFDGAPLNRLVGWGVVTTGVAAVICSVMIYVVTRREFWRLENTALRFGLTSLVLGLATGWVTLSMAEVFDIAAGDAAIRELADSFRLWLGIAVLAKLGWEFALLRHLWSPHGTTLKLSAQLHTGPLANLTIARALCGLLGGLVFPALAVSELGGESIGPAYHVFVLGTFVALLSGELLERYEYFAGVATPRMPGAIR
jgi:Fe-S-cluster-containing dehydrogenase component/DMSO reductase anchor subunit